jgi:hypothetical protein
MIRRVSKTHLESPYQTHLGSQKAFLTFLTCSEPADQRSMQYMKPKPISLPQGPIPDRRVTVCVPRDIAFNPSR